MKQYSFQRQKMQIPQENVYTGMSIMKDFDEFLKTHFKFPSNNLKKINDFICEDQNMKTIINDLPTIISRELSYNQISLDFMKETDPNEKILEIVINSKLDEEKLLEKEDIISDGIIDNYPKPQKEYIILVEP